MQTTTSNEAANRDGVVLGKAYQIKLMPAGKGLAIANLILKGLGPAVGALVDNLETDEFEESTTFTDISIALIRQIDELNIGGIIKELLTGATREGLPVDIDRDFAGNYGELIAVVEFALKENFGSFFTDYLKAKGLEIPILREMMTRKAEKASSSEKE